MRIGDGSDFSKLAPVPDFPSCSEPCLLKIYTAQCRTRKKASERPRAMSTAGHSKITIRQPKPLKAKIAKAAALRGMTVTSFINGMLEIAAERTLRRIETRELTDRDSAALLVMLQKPPAPKAALRKAARRLREAERG